jgi:hypothetical protein
MKMEYGKWKDKRLLSKIPPSTNPEPLISKPGPQEPGTRFLSLTKIGTFLAIFPQLSAAHNLMHNHYAKFLLKSIRSHFKPWYLSGTKIAFL